MTLAAGSRLGRYDIVALIGVGGMGEVYRARDGRLNRDVAIKVLPEAWARDAERIARFEREARALASVNHPNIGGIHEFDQSGDSCFLVLELVDGQTLASRIAQGPITTTEALRIAGQMIDALDAAHEKGIIHRDLKPANVMLTADGSVKVLDFGLAKLASDESASPPASAWTNSPTAMASMAGTILGTAAYMAPEQATGKVVDKRADIWAFGLIVYEMLTGRSPFKAETLQETVAAVLKEEPDLNAVPEQTRPLLRQCLVKDPKRRLRDIGDATLLTDRMPQATPGVAPARWLWPAVATVLATVATVVTWAPWRQPPAFYVTRFQMPAPEGGAFGGTLDLSPDGRKLVFSAHGKDGRRRLWLRDMDALSARPIPGTELQSDFAGNLSWAPDNRFVAFADGNVLKKVDVTGSNTPVTIAELPNLAGKSSWSPDGVILIGAITTGPIWRVPEAGGEPTAVTALGKSETAHGLPAFLPDGRHFLYFRTAGAQSGIYIGSLDVPAENQPPDRLLASDSQAAYVTSAGRVLFVRQNRLLAQPLDPASLTLKGGAVMVAPSVGSAGTRAFFAAAPGGTLVYTGGTDYQLTWFDREGRRGEPVVEAVDSTYARLSPSGSQLAFDRVDGEGVDIWLTELARGVMTRLTVDRARDEFPIWSPDGDRILFRSNRNGVFDLYERRVDGTGTDQLVLHTDHEKWPDDWSHDGRYVIYEERTNQDDLWVLPLAGDRKPVALTRTQFSENHPQFSPDDRWIAYQSNQSGRWEVYIQPFISNSIGDPTLGAIYQVSRGGGQRPVWRADGKELVYLASDGRVVAVDVTTSPRLQTGTTRLLFQSSASSANLPRLQISGDGQRFLLRSLVADGGSGAITVVLNWQAALRP